MNEKKEIKLENYSPVRLVWGILKSDGTMEGRLCGSQEEIIEARKLFEEYVEFKLVKILK